MHPPSANVNTRSIHRFAIPTSPSTRYARDARSPRPQTSTTRPEGLANGFVAMSFLRQPVAHAMTKSTATQQRLGNKAGLLIHFMLFLIPIKLIKLHPKVRLIVLNKRIPNLPLVRFQVAVVIHGIDPAKLQGLIPFPCFGEVPRIGPWIGNTTDSNK